MRSIIIPISERLKGVRTYDLYSQSDISSILNVDRSTYACYETKNYFISTHACYDLVRKYNISVDWLLGKSDIKYID